MAQPSVRDEPPGEAPLPSQTEAPHTPAPDADRTAPRPLRSFARFLLLVLLIPALLYPWAFLIVTLPSYESWSTSQWGPMLEYAFDTRQQNADVVIFGDSSAFLGVDPKLVNAKLGIKSIVLPDTVGSIPVTQDAPLRTYLAHNPPPRLIVLYFSAWNLDFGHTVEGRLFEGEEMMLRHMSRRDIARFALHHPFELLEFPFRLYSTFGPKIVIAALHRVNREQETAEALGHAPYTEAFPPLKPSCRLPSAFLNSTDRNATVQALVRRYTTPQTQVMVYLAPVPDCRNSAALLAKSFAGVNAAPPRTLPPPDFAADPYYAHIRPDSVPAASALFAEALAARFRQPDLANSAAPARDGH